MIPYGEGPIYCPKCDTYMGLSEYLGLSEAKLRWHDEQAPFGDLTAHDYVRPESITVACPRCNWSYEMSPRDAQVSVTA